MSITHATSIERPLKNLAPVALAAMLLINQHHADPPYPPLIRRECARGDERSLDSSGKTRLGEQFEKPTPIRFGLVPADLRGELPRIADLVGNKSFDIETHVSSYMSTILKLLMSTIRRGNTVSSDVYCLAVPNAWFRNREYTRFCSAESDKNYIRIGVIPRCVLIAVIRVFGIGSDDCARRYFQYRLASQNTPGSQRRP